MVCFTQHNFKFDKNSHNNWFNILCKYYSGVNLTITIDGHKYSGIISEEFFNKLPSGNEFEVITERFWAELACIRVMPAYILSEPCGSPNENILKISETIDSIMKGRLNYGNCEISLSAGFKSNDFSEVIEAVKYLKTIEITRMYQGSSFIIFVLNDRYTIHVDNNEVCDGTVPIFDLNNGFLPNCFGFAQNIAEELNRKYFCKWHKKFLENNGSNWNDPIIH